MLKALNQHGADFSRPWRNSSGEIAHPDARRGGGGPGSFRDVRPLLGDMHDMALEYHPHSPKGRNSLINNGMEPAFAPAGTSGKTFGSEWKEFKHGDQIPAPVKKTGGKWVNVWPISAHPDPNELGRAHAEFKIDPVRGKLTPVTKGPEVAQELLTRLEDLEKEVAAAEKEQVDTANAIKKRQKKIADAEKELEAAKKKLEAATTKQEKDDAQFDIENAQGKIELEQGFINAHEQHIEAKKQEVIDLRAKMDRGVANVRLHEQTHLDISAKTAEHANKLLEHETVPANRQKIINAATDISDETDGVMDGLLNNKKDLAFGSEEADKALADWVAESSSQNYRSTIKEKIDALKKTL